MNSNLHLGELHSNNSINDKNNLLENYIPKCCKVKRIFISFNCFSEYRTFGKQTVSVSEDPVQMPRFAASDLALYSSPMSHKKDARLVWINVFLRPPRG